MRPLPSHRISPLWSPLPSVPLPCYRPYATVSRTGTCIPLGGPAPCSSGLRGALAATPSASVGQALQFSKHSNTFPWCLARGILCDLQPRASELMRWNSLGFVPRHVWSICTVKPRSNNTATTPRVNQASFANLECGIHNCPMTGSPWPSKGMSLLTRQSKTNVYTLIRRACLPSLCQEFLKTGTNRPNTESTNSTQAGMLTGAGV